MAEIKWIKLSTAMFDDEKIRLIESMPDRDSILVIWVKLLAQAGRCNAGGYVMLTEMIPYTDEMLATLFNRPLSTVRLALETFEHFGMIERDGQNIYISNFEKHQNLPAMERARELTRERVQRYRDRQKALPEGNANVTERNVTVTEQRKREKGEGRGENPHPFPYPTPKEEENLSKEQRELFNILLECPKVNTREVDKLVTLLEDYGSLGHDKLKRQFRNFVEWWPGPKKAPRKRPWATLRNWLEREVDGQAKGQARQLPKNYTPQRNYND